MIEPSLGIRVTELATKALQIAIIHNLVTNDKVARGIGEGGGGAGRSKTMQDLASVGLALQPSDRLHETGLAAVPASRGCVRHQRDDAPTAYRFTLGRRFACSPAKEAGRWA